MALKGFKMTEEHKHKISEAQKGKPKWDKKPHPFIGKHHSTVSKLKISLSKKGKPSSLKGKKFPDKRIEVFCLNCGTIIKRHPYQIKARNKHFCNKKCRGKYFSGKNCSLYRGGVWLNKKLRYAKTKQWYENNKERHYKKCRKWIENNIEDNKKWQKEYRNKNKEKLAKYDKDRKEHLKLPQIYWRNRYTLLFIKKLGCSVCGTMENLHTHHKVPKCIGKILGWSEEKIHAIDNLEVLCHFHHKQSGIHRNKWNLKTGKHILTT